MILGTFLFQLVGHFVLGEDEIQAEPKTLAIAVTNKRPSESTSQAQPDRPIAGQPFEAPNHEKGNNPESANQPITYWNSTDEEAIFPAILEFALGTFLETMEQVLENGTEPAARATIHHGSTKVKKIHYNSRGQSYG
ncbi:MAG: hypothetical protein HN627_05245 [Opitutae bacterium]|nr:hypothetical protein [Opitutae bacterium]